MWNAVEWVRVFSSRLWCEQITLHIHTWQGNKDPVYSFKFGFFVIQRARRRTMEDEIARHGLMASFISAFSFILKKVAKWDLNSRSVNICVSWLQTATSRILWQFLETVRLNFIIECDRKKKKNHKRTKHLNDYLIASTARTQVFVCNSTRESRSTPRRGRGGEAAPGPERRPWFLKTQHREDTLTSCMKTLSI